MPLVHHDQPGAYAYETPAQAERRVLIQQQSLQAERKRFEGTARPLVVSCGNQRRQSVVVVAPCGHVGKSQSGLSTCPCGLVVHELEAVS